jgi:hypothetical protein
LQTAAKIPQQQNQQELTNSAKSSIQNSLQKNPENSTTKTLNQPQFLPVDLAEIVTIWPTLSPHIKKVIQALIKINDTKEETK